MREIDVRGEWWSGIYVEEREMAARMLVLPQRMSPSKPIGRINEMFWLHFGLRKIIMLSESSKSTTIPYDGLMKLDIFSDESMLSTIRCPTQCCASY